MSFKSGVKGNLTHVIRQQKDRCIVGTENALSATSGLLVNLTLSFLVIIFIT